MVPLVPLLFFLLWEVKVDDSEVSPNTTKHRSADSAAAVATGNGSRRRSVTKPLLLSPHFAASSLETFRLPQKLYSSLKLVLAPVHTEV